MSGKIIYVLIAALVLVGAGFYWYDAGHKPALAPTIDTNTQQTDKIPTDNSQSQATAPNDNSQSAAAKPSTGATSADTAPHYSDESDLGGADVAVSEVDYNGTVFSPASLTIKTGDIVVFKNTGQTDFRPASNAYAGFDSIDPVPPGGLFQFKFIKIGKWTYADKLNLKATGTITVTK